MWPLWVFDPGKVKKPDESQAQGSTQELLLWITFEKEFFFCQGRLGQRLQDNKGLKDQKWHLLLRAAAQL